MVNGALARSQSRQSSWYKETWPSSNAGVTLLFGRTVSTPADTLIEIVDVEAKGRSNGRSGDGFTECPLDCRVNLANRCLPPVG
jgi:hypothetical protein